MASLLDKGGYSAVSQPSQASVIIVNTCGFIASAREESIQVLNDLIAHKEKGQKIIAAGCLTERYREQLIGSIPGLDGLLGTRRWMDILEIVRKIEENQHVPICHFPEVTSMGKDEIGVLRAAVQGSSAYLKIADGCRRECAFCAIPLIKGSLQSRPLRNIFDDAKILQDSGIQELILIAQDTTDFGYDLGLKDGLSILLDQMVIEVPKIPWIRILYAYPGFISDRLINIIKDHPQILPYIDLPLQHADPEILSSMKRPANMDWVYRTIEKLRCAIPALALRSTFIVGYPGETEVRFNKLLQFVKEIAFDHLGVFTYSMEKGTAAELLGDPIPQGEKMARMDEVMNLQAEISLQHNQKQIGRTLDVLVEGYDNGISIGRTYRDAPEIDGLAIAEGKAEIGKIVPMLVTGAMTHDLTGRLV